MNKSIRNLVPVTTFINKFRFPITKTMTTSPITEDDVSEALELIYKLNSAHRTYTGNLMEFLFKLVMFDGDEFLIDDLSLTEPDEIEPVCEAIEIELYRTFGIGTIAPEDVDVDLDERIGKYDSLQRCVEYSRRVKQIRSKYDSTIACNVKEFRESWSKREIPVNVLYSILADAYIRSTKVVPYCTEYGRGMFEHVCTLIHNWESFKKVIEYVESVKLWFTDNELKNKAFDYRIKPYDTKGCSIFGCADAVFGNTIIDIKCCKSPIYVDICRQLHLYAVGVAKERAHKLEQYWLYAINFYSNTINFFDTDTIAEEKIISNERVKRRERKKQSS